MILAALALDYLLIYLTISPFWMKSKHSLCATTIPTNSGHAALWNSVFY